MFIRYGTDTDTERTCYPEPEGDETASFTHPDGTTLLVTRATWERRGNGFPHHLWLTSLNGHEIPVDPHGALPGWLSATAPDWVDGVPETRKAVG